MEHDEVHDRSSFIRYLASLRTELNDPLASADWENVDLPAFLEAMQAWATDCKEPANSNSWRHAADLLTAAITYE